MFFYPKSINTAAALCKHDCCESLGTLVPNMRPDLQKPDIMVCSKIFSIKAL